MYFGRVLDKNHMLALTPIEIHLAQQGHGITQHRRANRGIYPHLCDHLRAVLRTNLISIGLDDFIKRGGIDKAFVDQKRLKCFDAQGGIRRQVRVRMIMWHGPKPTPKTPLVQKILVFRDGNSRTNRYTLTNRRTQCAKPYSQPP